LIFSPVANIFVTKELTLFYKGFLSSSLQASKVKKNI